MQGSAFVVVEKDIVRPFLDGNAEVEKGRITGYKLCIVEDWVLDGNKGFCCFLEPTHDPQDVVVVDIIRPKNYSFVLSSLQNTLQKSNVQQYEIKLDSIKDSLVGNNGNVLGLGLVCSGPAFAIAAFKTLSIRYLDNAEPQDFDSNRIAISYLATLRCLGCTTDTNTNTHNRSNSTNIAGSHYTKGVNDAISRAESVFRRNYKAYTVALASIAQGSPNFNNESIPHSVEALIKDVKMALVHLHYLPFMTKIDGVFTNTLISSLAKFQADYNAKWDIDKDKPQLIPTGLITPECVSALLSRLVELKKKLDVLGFKTHDSKLQQSMSFPAIVRVFNERAKSDSSAGSRVSRGFSPTGTDDKEKEKEIKDKAKEEKEKTKITEEDRALLDNIMGSQHQEMKKKAKERKGKKDKDKEKEKEKEKEKDSIPKQDDPIERELRRKLSLLNSSTSLIPSHPPPSPPPDPAEDAYVVCERERFVNWASEYGFQVSEPEVMVGYRLYVVPEWMNKGSQLWSVVEFTGAAQDKLVVSSVSPSRPSRPPSIRSSAEGSLLPSSIRSSADAGERSASPTVARKILSQLIMQRPAAGGSYTIHTPRGHLVLFDRASAPRHLSFIPIPDGNFDAHVPCLQLQITLQRFGCAIRPPAPFGVDVQTLPIELTFLKIYAPYLPPTMEVPTNPPQVKKTLAAATHLVSEVQAALCHLNYLPLLAKIDGIMDTRTEYAIKAFQRDHSHTDPDGTIDIGTYREIRNSVVQLSNRLASLGFTPPHDPVRSYHAFNKLVRSFQAEYGAYPEAPGYNVLQALDRLHLATNFESSGLSMRGAKGVEQYLPTTLPLPGSGCLSFMAKGSDNITIIFTSTHPPPSPTTSSDPPPVVQVQNVPFSSDSDSFAYPHSPPLRPHSSAAVPIINLNNEGITEHQQQQVYHIVIGSGNNSLTVLKRSVGGSPMVVCATSSTPQSVVSPLVWDTYWVSVDGGTGWLVFGKGEVIQQNILLKFKDPLPLSQISHVGLSCWENPVDFAQIRIGLPMAKYMVDDVHHSPHSSATEDEGKELSLASWNKQRGGTRSLSTSPLPRRDAPLAITSPPASANNNSAPTSAFSSSLPSSLSSDFGYLEGRGEGSGGNYFGLEGDTRMSPVAWDENNIESEEELFSDEEKYSTQKASLEEKAILRGHIIKLNEMLSAQKETTQALQDELADLTVCYSNLKEQSLQAYATLQANERLLKDLNEKYGRVFQVEIPDILDRLSSNSHALQTYNVKIKKLDDIVKDVTRKNERNMFSTIFMTLLTWLLSVVAMIMLGVTTITNGLRSAALRLLPPPPSHDRAPETDHSADLSVFINEQRAAISKIMGEFKED